MTTTTMMMMMNVVSQRVYNLSASTIYKHT